MATPLDIEIDRVRRRVEQRETEIEIMEREARGACCPSCFHGSKYVAAVETQARAQRILASCLRKRGGPGDANEARQLDLAAEGY